MKSKNHEKIDQAVTDLLELLHKRIKDGSATAAEQANFIKLLSESGYSWHAASEDAPAKSNLPSFEDEEGDVHIPFPSSKAL